MTAHTKRSAASLESARYIELLGFLLENQSAASRERPEKFTRLAGRPRGQRAWSVRTSSSRPRERLLALGETSIACRGIRGRRFRCASELHMCLRLNQSRLGQAASTSEVEVHARTKLSKAVIQPHDNVSLVRSSLESITLVFSPHLLLLQNISRVPGLSFSERSPLARPMPGVAQRVRPPAWWAAR